jgi:ssDNA thymidine ADP-ribosyltransferase, DarT/HEAT repeats
MMLKQLLDDLTHGTYKKRCDAADKLGHLKDRSAVEPLIHMLEKEWDDDVIVAAIKALGHIGDNRAVEPLQKLYDEEFEERILNEIRTALLILCPATTTSEQTLIHTSKNRLVAYFEKIRADIPNAGFAYHFTDISNLGNIISEGFIYSRNNVARKKLIVTQGGDKHIIDKTPLWVKDYTRCYLRPRPPMLYNVEGIKSKPSQDKWRGHKKPHIPIPVYLIFNIVDLLVMLPENDVVVFDGNAASNGSSCSKNENLTPLEFLLLAIDWSSVFIDQIDPGDLYTNNKRQAEMIIKDRLSMRLCSRIVFRSDAEKKLARQLIPDINNYNLSINREFYNCQKTYVENVEIKSSRILIRIMNYHEGCQLLGEIANLYDNKPSYARSFHQQDETLFLHRFSNLTRGKYRLDLYIHNEEGEKFLVCRDSFRIT